MKKSRTYKEENCEGKGSKKRGEPAVALMIAVGKPKPLPKRGQRTATNKMSKKK